MIRTAQELDDLLSAPSEADVAAMGLRSGDLIVLGAGTPMGRTLVRRARRAAAAAGASSRILAVAHAAGLGGDGAQTLAADLRDRDQVARLPKAANVICMAGPEFDFSANDVGERYRDSRIVVFSDAAVYPPVPAGSRGAVESTPPAPAGEYAQALLARERVFERCSSLHGTPVLLLRLSNPVEPRHGVLAGIAANVLAHLPIDLTAGYVNVIWEGDAGSLILRSFALCESPAMVLNLTGPECLSVRWLAGEFGLRFGVEPVFAGAEGATALLSDASLCQMVFGPLPTGVSEMIDLVAGWLLAQPRDAG
jgi:nucleoside-diphosphate-sugar epimerase